jgi:hypothetical protein
MKPLDNTVGSSLSQLAPELVRRWGKQPRYSVAQVTQAAEAAGLAADVSVYAHAIYCSQTDFDAHYGARSEACDYAGIRAVITNRSRPGDSGTDLAALLMMMG